MGLLPLVLLGPQPGEAVRGAQLPQFRVLLAGDRHRAQEARFGLLGARHCRQHLAYKPFELCLEPALARAPRMKGLGRQAELLRTGIRTLGGALLGAATVGRLAALVDRSISAADAIGKTADKIGVGVEALQELRFAAKASGVEQQTLDMALQRFARRAAEAAQGTGEAKDALAQMGIALRDQRGNLRQSEDLLGDVADAFARIEDPAERVRLAFKLFDSEGVALVNLLRGGSGALEEIRDRARDLGIVLDEHLVRDAERARGSVSV